MGFYFSVVVVVVVVVVVITITSFELVIREDFYHAPGKKKLEHSTRSVNKSASREKER